MWSACGVDPYERLDHGLARRAARILDPPRHHPDPHRGDRLRGRRGMELGRQRARGDLLAKARLDSRDQLVDHRFAELASLVLAAEEHAHQLLVLRGEREQLGGALAHTGDPIRSGALGRGRQTLAQPVERLEDDLAEEHVFVAKMQVEGARGDAGAVRDLDGRGPMQTLPRKERDARGFEPTPRRGAASIGRAAGPRTDVGFTD
jgi:hypothetical protein